MNDLRKDVRDLITVNEKIQSALAQGDRFTDDETAIIRMCAGELLEKMGAIELRYDDGDGRADRPSGREPSASRRQDEGRELGLSQIDRSA